MKREECDLTLSDDEDEKKIKTPRTDPKNKSEDLLANVWCCMASRTRISTAKSARSSGEASTGTGLFDDIDDEFKPCILQVLTKTGPSSALRPCANRGASCGDLWRTSTCPNSPPASR